MAFCVNCGSELTPGGTFCPSCGHRDPGTSSEEATARIPASSNEPEPFAAPPEHTPSPAEPPPPPSGYRSPGSEPTAVQPAYPVVPVVQSDPVGFGTPVAASPAFAGRRGMSAFLVSPVVAALGVFAMSAFGLIWEAIDFGIQDVVQQVFGTAPGSFFSIFIRLIPIGEYSTYGGESYVPWGDAFILLPAIVMLIATAWLASRARGGVGARLTAGLLVGPILAALIAVMYAVASWSEWGDYPGATSYILSYIWRAAVAALVIGSVSGFFGALLSIAIRRPTAT